MYLTHTFAHRETLSRAHAWLSQHGFRPRQFGAHTSGVPRLVVEDEPHRLAAAKLLISAAEHSDPYGFASLWDKPQPSHSARREHREDLPARRHEPHSWVIGWHPID